MMKLAERDLDSAVLAVPAPPGMEWTFDPSASGDRLRLWDTRAEPMREWGRAYGDGRWAVCDPHRYPVAATGNEDSLENAMRRMLRVATVIHEPLPPPEGGES